jgi:hypothetical protein
VKRGTDVLVGIDIREGWGNVEVRRQIQFQNLAFFTVVVTSLRCIVLILLLFLLHCCLWPFRAMDRNPASRQDFWAMKQVSETS